MTSLRENKYMLAAARIDLERETLLILQVVAP